MSDTPRQSDDDDSDVDKGLRQAFEDILNEELPDRFVKLLDRLRSGDIPETRSEDERE